MGDKFSFPVMSPNSSDDFEFGSITSPSSPADHLFSNGKLLPHTYTVQVRNNFSYSRSTSRASSKDSLSLMSSRSNSTNSRSSTSARTSTSANTSEASSERRSPARRNGKIARPVVTSCQYQCRSSRRWQLIAAAPVLRRQASSRSKRIDARPDRKVSKGGDEGTKGTKAWPGRAFFKSFMSACKECHAIKT